ncbi:MAG: LON peptidase substrate-binding domain-containing protein [Acidimicrobiales bacterium]
MFPLEHTVLPGAVVPLHVFEPRYRELARRVTSSTDPEFGTVLIERGREVGGADERTLVGVVLRVVDAEEFPDGRWGLSTVATRRIRVEEWLDDAPYPRATVTDWPDDDATTYRDDLDQAMLERIVGALERCRTARRRLGPARTAPPAAWPTIPPGRSWQAATIAGLGPLGTAGAPGRTDGRRSGRTLRDDARRSRRSAGGSRRAGRVG